MKPADFAALLISRLESLKREQDTISSLEERLQQIQEVCVTLLLSRKVNPESLGFFSSHDFICRGGVFFPGRGKRRHRDHRKCSPALPPPSDPPLWLLRRGPTGHPGRTPLARPEDPWLPVTCCRPPLASLQLPGVQGLHSARIWSQAHGEEWAFQFLCH